MHVPLLQVELLSAMRRMHAARYMCQRTYLQPQPGVFCIPLSQQQSAKEGFPTLEIHVLSADVRGGGGLGGLPQGVVQHRSVHAEAVHLLPHACMSS